MADVSAAAIRPATLRDAAAVQAVYAPYVSGTVVSFEEVPPSADEIGRRMRAQPRLPWLVAIRGGLVVGFCYASRHRERPAYRWSVDASIYLREDERGRGTGRLLYRRLFVELQGLGYVSVFAGITLPNEASVRLHEALGFVPVGVCRNVGFKGGGWRDVGWWQLALCEPSGPPDEPRAWRPGG